MGADYKQFKELLKKAIGSHYQKEFAERAGISPYGINRMLNSEDSASMPRKNTLEKIAAASENRVTLNQLLDACGYPLVNDTKPVDIFADQEKSLQIAMNYADGVKKLSGTAMKYDSVEVFLETTIMAHGCADMQIKLWQTDDYHGPGHKNAEKKAHCSVFWTNMTDDFRLDFTLFFLETTGGGVVISDASFDLTTIVETQPTNSARFLLDAAEKGDVNYSDYPLVFSRSLHTSGVAEKRLLKAIFGD